MVNLDYNNPKEWLEETVDIIDNKKKIGGRLNDVTVQKNTRGYSALYFNNNELSWNKTIKDNYEKVKNFIVKREKQKEENVTFINEVVNNPGDYTVELSDDKKSLKITTKSDNKYRYLSKNSFPSGSDLSSYENLFNELKDSSSDSIEHEESEPIEHEESESSEVFSRSINERIMNDFKINIIQPDFNNWLYNFINDCKFKNIYIKNSKLVTELPDYKYTSGIAKKYVYFTINYNSYDFRADDINIPFEFSDAVPPNYIGRSPFDIIEEYIVNIYRNKLKDTSEGINGTGYIFQRLKSSENNRIAKEYTDSDGWFYTSIEQVNYNRKEIDAEFYFRFESSRIPDTIEIPNKFEFYRHRSIPNSKRQCYIPIDFDFIKSELMNGYLYSMLNIFNVPSSFENIKKIAFNDYINFIPKDSRICKGDPDTNEFSYTKGWGRLDQSTITFKGRAIDNNQFNICSDNWRDYINAVLGNFVPSVNELNFCVPPQTEISKLKFVYINLTKSNDIEKYIEENAKNNPEIGVTIFYANPKLVENVGITTKIDVLSSKVSKPVWEKSGSFFDPLKSSIGQALELGTLKAREYGINPTVENRQYMVYADMWYYTNRAFSFSENQLELDCNRIDPSDPNYENKDPSYSIKFKDALTKHYLEYINNPSYISQLDNTVCDYHPYQAKQKDKNKDKKGNKSSSATLDDILLSSPHFKNQGSGAAGNSYQLKDHIKNNISIKFYYDDKRDDFDPSRYKYYYNGIQFNGNNLCTFKPGIPSADVLKIQDKFKSWVKNKLSSKIKEYSINISQPVDINDGWWYTQPIFDEEGIIDIYKTKIFYKEEEVDPEILKYLSSLVKKKDYELKPTNRQKEEIDPVDAYYSFKQLLSLKLTEHYRAFYEAKNIIRNRSDDHIRKLKAVKEGHLKEKYNENTCKLLDNSTDKIDPIKGWWYDNVDIVDEELTYRLYYKGRNIPKNVIERCNSGKVKALKAKIIKDFINKNPEFKSRVDPDKRSTFSSVKKAISSTTKNIYSGVKSVGQYGHRKIQDIVYGVKDIAGID